MGLKKMNSNPEWLLAGLIMFDFFLIVQANFVYVVGRFLCKIFKIKFSSL